MAATITGIVFDDLNHNGILDVGEPGIPNAYVVIEDPNGVCTTVQTDELGVYTFSGLDVVGDHTIYETAVDAGATCPPTTFGQPTGFTNSTTFRSEVINVSGTDITDNETLTGKNYGHDNPNTFTCVAVGYQVAVPQGGVNSEFIEVNLVTGTPTVINNNIGFTVNGIGYNVLDDMIYGMQQGTSNLIRIDENGVATNFGAITNLPVSNYNVGTMDNLGQLYLYGTNQANFYIVDVDQNSPTFGQVIAPSPVPMGPALPITDWAYNPVDGQLYAVNNSTGDVEVIDPTTGIVTTLTTTNVPVPATAYGAVFMDASGTLYAIDNSTGDVYRITISGGNANGELFSQAVPSNQNDGASCQNAFIEIDFGDAPDIALGNGPGNYNTLLASNGPRHQIINNLTLGTQVTAENDAYQNPTATGDDLTQGIQDDGVTLPLTPILTCYKTYSFDILASNNTGSPANLYVWIDFNQNGIFEANEISAPIIVPSGNINPRKFTANFNIPGTLTPGNTFVRARLTTDTLINTNVSPNAEDARSLGPASDGEVEDYLIEILDPTSFVNPIKTADKSFAQPGEIINYTVVIPNMSNVDVYNLIFRDILEQGLTLVPGSFTINGTVVNNPNLTTGVNLGDILAGEEPIIVAFSAIVSEDDELCGTTITNKAFIDLEFCPGEQTTIETNTVETIIECINLEIIKTSDTDLLLVGDTVTFTTTITNNSSIPLDNIVFTDEIPENTTFVEDSVKINGVTQIGVNPESGIQIGTLNPGETVIISFSVILDQVGCPPSISNRATATYEYTVESETIEETISGSQESNLVVIAVAPTTFKQLSKDEIVEIPKQKPDVEEILSTLVDIEIVNKKVIKTIVRKSNEGQMLTGFKLIVEGRLNQKIEYVALECEQSVHSAHFKVPFSTYIILPDSYVEGTEIDIEAEIEDIYTKIINPRTIFKNITFRLLVKQFK